MSEIWKDIVGYEGVYQVSNLGGVRRLNPSRPKKLTLAANGYFVVGLWKDNSQYLAYVHDLVAAAFVGPKAPGMSVNHMDGKKPNNRWDNFEYISLADNTRHQMASGLNDPRGESNGHAKLTEAKVREIRDRAAAGERTCDLAREYGVKPPIISQIKGRDRWAHVV